MYKKSSNHHHTMASNAKADAFVPIRDLVFAGLGASNEARLFFRREAFRTLSDFCDRAMKNKQLGLIDGLPGTGKSTTLWYKMHCLAKDEDKRVVWIHFDRQGEVVAHTLVTKNGCKDLPDPAVLDIASRFNTVEEADVLVCDGANNSNFKDCLRELRRWKKAGGRDSATGRVGFITMSNKIKREHRHELEMLKARGQGQEYCTQYSWTLQEYIDAFVQQDGTRSQLFIENVDIFEKEWEIREDTEEAEKARRAKRNKLDRRERKPIARVKEIITQKSFYAGGSARWMLQLTKAEIEVDIRGFLNEAQVINNILMFNLGTGSPVAKTHLYASAPAVDGSGGVQYTMVSERATQLIVEKAGRSAISTLYAHAAKIGNPAFLGWVLEADYFSRCENNSLQLVRPNGTSFKVSCPNQPVEFDVASLELLASFQKKSDLKEYFAKLVPATNLPTVGKPKSWNQGGYDVVRIQRVPGKDNELDLLFGQITKSLSHSLKLQFFEELANFFVEAGYVIRSIEIGFIVPSEQAGSFTVPYSAVTASGRLIQHTVYGTTAKWTQTKEHTQVAIYGLAMDGMNYPTAASIASPSSQQLNAMSTPTSQPPQKKLRATRDLDAPGVKNYEDVWTAPDISEESLKTPGTLFGCERSWFVRPSYVKLYDDIMDDKEYLTQIVNGTAGIGKSSFLLYMLARCRCAGKSSLLHFHRTEKETAIAVFFPVNGKPLLMSANSSSYFNTFREWYDKVGAEKSLFLVDGVVSFTKDDVPGVKYVTAKSPSCSIGFMEKDQNRFDRWLEFWSRSELLAYAESVAIPNASEIIDDNMLHVGGISRYAFTANNARNAVMNAISVVGAKKLFKVVKTGLMGKYDQQKVVDRLIHRHPPEAKTGIFGTTFTFASAFVATRVAMALCLETEIQTAELLRSFERVGAAGGMRGVLFEAYAARRLATGGEFTVKEVGSANETTLDVAQTAILQKDTKTLNKTNYPVQDIKDRVVWPNPSYNMPAIDAFMLLLQECIAFQMTVASHHGLDLQGTKSFLKYFDSVNRELFPEQSTPQQYSLYFVVPTDTYEKFSAKTQPITGTYGVTLNTAEATTIGKRVKQWIMKID
jgi:hypothetical protein